MADVHINQAMQNKSGFRKLLQRTTMRIVFHECLRKARENCILLFCQWHFKLLPQSKRLFAFSSLSQMLQISLKLKSSHLTHIPNVVTEVFGSPA